MTYNLELKQSALNEWQKLDHTVQAQFKKRLKQRLENPYVPFAALSGAQNTYKIKLHQLGYRFVIRLKIR